MGRRWRGGEEADAVAGAQGERGVGELVGVVAQDGDRHAGGRPGDAAELRARGGDTAACEHTKP